MNVLGIHSHSHDAGAALVRGGRLFGISLERISRKKHDGRFPAAAIEYVMRDAGLRGFGDIDLAVCDALGMQSAKARRDLRKMGYRGAIETIPHHDAHAASAYFTSPFEEAAILVVDAAGSFAAELPGPPPLLAAHDYSRELQSAYAGRKGNIVPILKTFSAPGRAVGPGSMYGLAAMMAGFSDIEGGKLMSLAALGERDNLFPDVEFADFEGHFLASGDPERDPLLPANLNYYSKMFFRGVKPRLPGEPILQIHCEIARAADEKCRAAALAMARRLHDATRCENLCVAGGFGLNCPTNSAFLKETPFRNVFIHPAATDAGIPLGAALHGYHLILNQPFRPKQFSPFLGRIYTEHEIKTALKGAGNIKYSKPKNIYKSAAELLAEGKVCGWFRGRGEHGPRALGARSILANPETRGIKEKLNDSIKFRESFRPYAPAVLEEKCAEHFRFNSKSPHMLLLADAKAATKKRFPSILHVNGTARLQTVSERDNPGLRRLLAEFEKITGIPMLLNTSFNRSGEPIVESPRDALACFAETGLDFLAMENYLVLKK